MAGFVQNLLQDAAGLVKREAGNAVKSFFTAEYLRDYTHASKTFRTNSYGYAPKFKFLFHVYFDINTQYIPATQNWPNDKNFGLAVKSINLPKYSFDTHVLNQYNRRRIVQTKIKYDPVTVTFHDDTSNLIRRLWYTYYTYYYKDATQVDNFTNGGRGTSQVPGAGSDPGKYDMNRRNIYDSDITGNDDWGYIGESGTPATATAAEQGISKAPFFRAINVFGFNQHNFVMYRLVNPMVSQFSHDTYDYSAANGIMENSMTLEYETVKYYEGAIDGRTPDKIVTGFGSQDHYDTTLSPIARPGSQATILGPGGLVSAAGGILNDIENGNYLGAFQKAGASYNTFKNPQTLLNAGKAAVAGVVTDAIQGTPNRNGQFAFPTDGSTIVKNATNAVNSTIGEVVTKPKPVTSTTAI